VVLIGYELVAGKRRVLLEHDAAGPREIGVEEPFVGGLDPL
jgi:hypothetical protein